MPKRVAYRNKMTVHVFAPGTAEARAYCAGEGRFLPLETCQSCPHFGGMYKPAIHKNTVIRCLPMPIEHPEHQPALEVSAP